MGDLNVLIIADMTYWGRCIKSTSDDMKAYILVHKSGGAYGKLYIQK